MTDDAAALLVLEAVDLAGFALPRRSGKAAEVLLKRALDNAQRQLLALARKGATRQLQQLGGTFWTPRERGQLADVFLGVLGLSRALGVAVVRARLDSLKRRGRLKEAVQPDRAIEYLLSLVLSLGDDPQRGGIDMRRYAFTLAVATETELLGRVRDAIVGVLATGELGQGPRAVQAVLDAAGVATSNPSYATMVFRTNAKTAYDDSLQIELSQERELFPVWRYSNPDDSRSRPEHAAKDGNYYPSTVPFTTVRGTDKSQVINCRCVQVPIDKWDWEALRKNGARLVAGFEQMP